MHTLSKIIVTSKINLQSKYGSKYAAVIALLQQLIAADKQRKIKGQLVFIDDPKSAAKAGIKVAKSVTRRSCKEAIDALYQRHIPSYMVIFGAQDVIPFQEIVNPADDEDKFVPSDLPYACDKPYGTRIKAFTGPTRVLGRIPDLPGRDDAGYVQSVVQAIIQHKPVQEHDLMDYFSISADVWKKSTRQSLLNIFGNSTRLKLSPPVKADFTRTDLRPRTHFYNCHGALTDPHFYGEKSGRFPVAQHAPVLKGKITPGTLVAAECCYGAELYDPMREDNREMGIANAYLKEGAVAFVGSSTIAYGPADGQDLADLITQYFVKNVISGSSTGRALLEARQQYLATVGPQLDPYELKTLAQFYLLGDPSLHLVVEKDNSSGEEFAKNSRLTLFNRGMNLSKTMAPAQPIRAAQHPGPMKSSPQLKAIFRETGFTGKEKGQVFNVRFSGQEMNLYAKSMASDKGDGIRFRTYIRAPQETHTRFRTWDVLLIKESGHEVIAWKLYHRK